MPRTDRTPHLSAVSLAGLCLMLLTAACTGEEARDSYPSVVLIVLEDARADHVSCYGYEKLTTPALDALASTAARYSRCRASSPGTLASVASMFTGRFTYQHEAHPILPDELLIERPLELGRRTLAEVLGEAGYSTAAFVSDSEFLGEEHQLDQGFERYVVEGGSGRERNARILDWLGEVDGPFFLCVSYSDARPPYENLPLQGERSASIAAEGVLHTSTLLDELRQRVLFERQPAPPSVIAELHARYELGLANADLALGELLDRLRTEDLFEETLVIVTSDHGTYFGEHGLIGHSKDVYEEALHVPLVCKAPGTTGAEVIDHLVSGADVPGLVAASVPTELADRLRAEFPLPLERNVSMAELYYSRREDVQRYGERFRRTRRVLYVDDYKVIRSSDGRNGTYDLAQDPGETTNLVASEGKLTHTLSMRLVEFLRENPVEPLSEPSRELGGDAQVLRRLREVGYPSGEEPDDVGYADDE